MGNSARVRRRPNAETAFARDLGAGFITAIVAITYALSYGALLFTGPLADRVADGMSIMLTTAAIGGVVVALTSSFRFAIGGADSNTTAVFAVIGTTLAERLDGHPDVAAHRLALVLMIGAVVTGVTFVVLGRLHLGRWIRFIPYPIVAGFLAASGWLLVNGSLRVIAGVSLPSHLDAARTPSGAAQLAVGVGVATVLFVLRRYRDPLIVPGFLLTAILMADLVLSSAIGLPAARAAGWLVPQLGAPHLTSLLDPGAYAAIDWRLIGETTPAVVTAVVVTLIAILFGAAGLEAQTGADADLDRELRSSGLASIASGLLGGSVAILLASRTIINGRAGATTRASGVTVAVLCALGLLGGGPILSLIVRPVLGGLLLAIGVGLLVEWLGGSFRRLSRSDALLVLTIVVVTGVSGFLTALAIGLIFSCVTFAIRYGQLRAVRSILSVSYKRSRVERGAHERALLAKHGEGIRILILQGYIFFGTAYVVFQQARAVLTAENAARVRALIVDFENVTGIDSSAANSLTKLAVEARRAGATLMWSGLSPADRDLLQRSGIVFDEDGRPRAFRDLDHALETAEEELLADLADEDPEPLENWLARELGLPAGSPLPYGSFERVTVAAGELLFRRDDVADAMYLVLSGRLHVYVGSGEERTRVRSMSAGSFVGEMGVYGREPRSADVEAETDAVLLRLSAEALDRLSRANPYTARALHRLLFRLQGERLRFANAEIAALHS